MTRPPQERFFDNFAAVVVSTGDVTVQDKEVLEKSKCLEESQGKLKEQLNNPSGPGGAVYGLSRIERDGTRVRCAAESQSGGAADDIKGNYILLHGSLEIGSGNYFSKISFFCLPSPEKDDRPWDSLLELFQW